MFIGILIGLAVGIFLTFFIRLPIANWSKFIESAGIGFGIGLAFIAAGWLLNLLVKFGDKQSQKVKAAGR